MWLNTGLHIFQFTVCGKTGKPHWISTEFYITGTDEYSKCLTKNLNKFSGIKTCNIPMVRYFTYIGKFCVRTELMIPEYFSKAGTMWHERRIILKGRKSTCSPGGKGSNTCFLSWHPLLPEKRNAIALKNHACKCHSDYEIVPLIKPSIHHLCNQHFKYHTFLV